MVLLKNESNIAANSAQSSAPPPMEAAALDPDFPTIRPQLAVNQPEEGCLAGAARPGDLDQLTRGD